MHTKGTEGDPCLQLCAVSSIEKEAEARTSAEASKVLGCLGCLLRVELQSEKPPVSGSFSFATRALSNHGDTQLGTAAA